MGVPRSLGYAAALAAIGLSGCNDATATPDAVEQWELDALQASHDRVAQTVELMQQAENSEPFKLSDDGFTILQTNAGPATFQWTGVAPNGNGVRATFKVGNLTNASWNRYEIFGLYGKLNNNGEPDTSQPSSFRASSQKPVYSGYWNTVAFQIDGPEPEGIGYIDILTVSVSNVALNPEP